MVQRLRTRLSALFEVGKKLGYEVEANNVSQFLSSWIIKGPALTKAFLRDYQNNQDGVNWEMASLLSSTALAIDHQSKVVCRVVGGKGMQSHLIQYLEMEVWYCN